MLIILTVKKSFFYCRYDSKLARFEDIPQVPNKDNLVKFCDSCVRNAAKDKVYVFAYSIGEHVLYSFSHWRKIPE